MSGCVDRDKHVLISTCLATRAVAILLTLDSSRLCQRSLHRILGAHFASISTGYASTCAAKPTAVVRRVNNVCLLVPACTFDDMLGALPDRLSYVSHVHYCRELLLGPASSNRLSEFVYRKCTFFRSLYLWTVDFPFSSPVFVPNDDYSFVFARRKGLKLFSIMYFISWLG